MAFDPLNYEMKSPFPLATLEEITQTFTTANVIKKYTPGQYACTWDPLFGYRVFKIVKNLSGATIAKGDLMSYVNAASVGTVTAGTTTSITSSSMTANDLEYQMILVTDDAGAAGAAPEGEASLCIANTTTLITLHSNYAFSVAVAASDGVYVVYINGVEDGASGDLRGPGKFTNCVAGLAYGAAADNEWFWILQKGWGHAKTDAVVSTGAGDVKPSTSTGATIAEAAVNAGQEIIIGHSPVDQFAGNEGGFATVYLDVFSSIHQQTTP